jgi:hypothetical protein
LEPRVSSLLLWAVAFGHDDALKSALQSQRLRKRFEPAATYEFARWVKATATGALGTSVAAPTKTRGELVTTNTAEARIP